MGRPINVVIDPFDGVSESGVTSNVIDVRDAFDHTISWRTTSGTTSINTIQISVNTFRSFNQASIPEGSWSNWSTFGDSQLSQTINPPLGETHVRILRENSGASFEVRSHKVVETS